jgi:para-nitrobenzyl esterase
VLFWMHAGGNNGGNGSIGAYNGWAFARDEVVLVTINWRIGMMGFLELGEHLPEYAGSGNNALRDHIAALTWVRDNIAAFGGDPTNVTLGGVLGGARNVVALLATPRAEGLFHKCIAQSTGGFTYHTPYESRRVARLGVDAHTGDAKDLLTATPAELVVATSKARWSYSNNTPWRPHCDGSLVPLPPVQAYAAGASKDIPLLVGMNRDESPSNLPADFTMQKIFPINSNELQAMDMTSLNSIDFRYQRAFPNLSPLDRRYRLITGEEYIIPTLRMLDARIAAGAAPTYLFRFDNALTAGRYKGYTISGLDVHYQFETLGIDGKQEVVETEGVFSDEDQALARSVHTAWVNFVKTGKPTAPGLPDWTPYDSERRQTMLLNHQSQVADDPWKDERVLWHDVFV